MNASLLRPSARTHGVPPRSEARVLTFNAAGFNRDETARPLRVEQETVKSQRESVLRKRDSAHAFVRGRLIAQILHRIAADVEASR